jgi:hypothetical protein
MLAPRTRTKTTFSITFTALSLALALSSTTANVCAQDARGDAAKAFDEGVKLYEKASYADAARAFLRADGLAPSRDALSNALAAARRSNDHLLVVTAAERAIARDSTEPELATNGRRALAEAAQHLARVDLKCEPTPCEVAIDGKLVEAGVRFLLPGTHVLSAKAGEARAQQAENLAAGTEYTILLHPKKPGEQQVKADVKTTKKPTEGKPKPRASDKPLPPAVFYTGVGLTVVLAGITTWSGFDALNAKNDLPDDPTKKEVTDVRNKVTRTDIFLAATVVVGGLTTYAGLRLVDFGGNKESAHLMVSPSSVSVVGSF